MLLPPFEIIVAIAIVIFFGIGLHEYAHCKIADAAGDPTPAYYGRVTLNLTKHFEPLGTLMIILTSLSGIGIGWGKPSPVNPSRMRNPKWDHFASVAAGPISNLLQAAVWGVLLRIALALNLISLNDVVNALLYRHTSFLAALLTIGVLTNLGLMLFNLIPLGGLDGHWLVGTFMPERTRVAWYQWNRRTGSLLLLGIVLFSQISNIPIILTLIGKPAVYLFRFLTGIAL